MKFTAIIMAGGKSSRMNIKIEKPLLKLGGITLIERVINAVKNSSFIDKIIVTVSPNTVNTKNYLKSIKGINILETSGRDYHEDMKFAIKNSNGKYFIVISADLPFITSEIINFIINKYIEEKKPSLTVITPLKNLLSYNLIPTYIIKINNEEFVPCGINIIDKTKIDEKYIEEIYLIMNNFEVVFNINTFDEYLKAREYMEKLKIKN
ncbi:MAG: NTP transferase domain-containing protein [Candidatus Verstraetearchaeota archaeon]|jgi:adenosylcobinamide-phosphate guanylyltransferase|nr:NTP transferase domain-containing protein [Candidatus Verstraetearchaeota archaeon]